MSLTRALDYGTVPSDQHITGSMKDFVSDKEWKELMQFYRKPCRYDSVDTINITVDECNQIVNSLNHDSYTLEQVFNQPSLRSFTAILTDENESVQICFRPSCLSGRIFRMRSADNSTTEFIPYIDMYVSYDSGDTTAIIFTIGRGLDNNGQESLVSAPLWCHPATDGDIPQGMTTFANVYPTIQVAMYERPTIFITEAENSIIVPPPQHKNPHKRHQHSKPHKVKVTRVIRINTQQIPKATRTYTCPNWGVIGHFRHYKSGKKVWINGYTKGPERHNPDAYQPKEYQLTTSEPQ